MKDNTITFPLIGWLFGILVLIIGLLNMLLVHPVPGLVFLLLSLIYFPPFNAYLKEKTRFTIPPAVKIILGIVIIWFTLGPSDMGDIIDSLAR